MFDGIGLTRPLWPHQVRALAALDRDVARGDRARGDAAAGPAPRWCCAPTRRSRPSGWRSGRPRSARTWCPPHGFHATSAIGILRPALQTSCPKTVSDDAWKDHLIAQGTPEQFASFALEIFTASRRGEFAAVDPALKELLGREPTRFRDVLAATLPR